MAKGLWIGWLAEDNRITSPEKLWRMPIYRAKCLKMRFDQSSCHFLSIYSFAGSSSHEQASMQCCTSKWKLIPFMVCHLHQDSHFWGILFSLYTACVGFSGTMCNPQPTAPHNGTVQVNSYYAHGTAEFRCHAGFDLSSADYLICSTMGVWIGTPPTCQGRHSAFITIWENCTTLVEESPEVFALCSWWSLGSAMRSLCM